MEKRFIVVALVVVLCSSLVSGQLMIFDGTSGGRSSNLTRVINGTIEASIVEKVPDVPVSEPEQQPIQVELVRQIDFDAKVNDIESKLLGVRSDLSSITAKVNSLVQDITVNKQGYDKLNLELNGLRTKVNEQPTLEQPTEVQEYFPVPLIFLLIINIFFLVFILYDYSRFHRKGKRHDALSEFEGHIEGLGQYIIEHLEKGFPFEFIKQHLLNAGWQEQHIHYAYHKKKKK